jgi:solute carrier family 25 protein 42
VFTLPAAGQELKRIVWEEGASSLWRGNGATMMRVLPYAAIQLTSFDHFLAFLRERGAAQGGGAAAQHGGRGRGTTAAAATAPAAIAATPVATERPEQRLLAGSMAGVTSVLFTYPLDLVRTRLAVETGAAADRRYRNTIQAAMRISQEEGVRALWNGIGPTLTGILPYAGIAFLTHGTLKDIVAQGNPVDPETGRHPVLWWQNLACGAVAGLFGQSITYPLDVVRRRMQAEARPLVGVVGVGTGGGTGGGGDGLAVRQMSVLGTMRHIAREEGFCRGLFKGLSMNWIKGPIAVGISFSTFDALKRHFGVERDH